MRRFSERQARLSLLLLLLSLPACGGGPARARAPSVEGASPAPVQQGPAPLPPSTPEELEVASRLRATVSRLSGIGPRDGASVWNLATATDDLALVLEGMGHTVRRVGFDVGDAVAQNLEVTVAGAGRGKEVIVVGAHHDTVPGSPGANANGSGVAGLVELVRAFQGTRPDRTLRFAFFTHAEAPYAQTETMGSLVYAKELAREGVRVIAMLSLDSIGFYSPSPSSQRYPVGFSGVRSSAGDFVAIVGAASSRLLVERTATEMKRYASLPVVSELHPSEAPGFGWSDHWAFLQTGVASLVVTDTASFRDPEHHRAGDLPERLDYDRMARVVTGLRKTLASIAGEATPVLAPAPSPEPG